MGQRALGSQEIRLKPQWSGEQPVIAGYVFICIIGIVGEEKGFSGGSVTKNPPCQCRKSGFDPGFRKSPWRGGQPTPVFLVWEISWTGRTWARQAVHGTTWVEHDLVTEKQQQLRGGKSFSSVLPGSAAGSRNWMKRQINKKKISTLYEWLQHECVWETQWWVPQRGLCSILMKNNNCRAVIRQRKACVGQIHGKLMEDKDYFSKM